MNKTLIIIGIIIVLVAGGFIFLRTGQYQNTFIPATTTQETTTTVRHEKAPDFHLQDYQGKTVNFGDFAGKSIVINSWASWCPFCRQELPDFVTVQQELGDKVVIIAIDRGESFGVAKKYTDQQGTTNNLIFLLDPSDSFYKSIGGFSMPETIFVDKNGFVHEHKRGPMGVDEIREKVKKLISA